MLKMANYFKIFVLVFVALVIISIFLVDEVEAKGGRGGGRGGRFGGSRSRSSSRSRSRNSIASRVRRSLRSRSFNWKTAAAAGTIYGWSRYSHSPRYRRSPNRRPQICVNLYDYQTNGTLNQMFICPLADQPEDYTYCCGPEDRQRCCRFWDNGGRVFGVVVAILIVVGVVVLVLYCCCCKKGSKTPGFIRGHSKQDGGAKYSMTTTAPPVAAATGYPNMGGSYTEKTEPQGGVYPAPSVMAPDGTTPYPVGPGAQPAAPYPSEPAPYPGGDAPTYPPAPGVQPVAPYPSDPAPYPGGDAPPYPPANAPAYPPQNGMPTYPPAAGFDAAPPANAPYPVNPAGPGGYPEVPPPAYPAN